MISLLRNVSRAALFAAVVALVVGLTPAQAQKTYSFPKKAPLFSITVPESWTEKQNDDDYFEVAKGDNEIYVGVWAFDADTKVEDAGKQIGEELGKQLKDIKSDWKTTTHELNGIKFGTFAGTGKYKNGGEPCEWEVSMFSPDDKSLFALMYYGDPGADKKYDADLKSILQSLKLKK